MELAILTIGIVAVSLVGLGVMRLKLQDGEIHASTAIDLYLEIDRNGEKHTFLNRLTDRRLDEPVAALRSLGFFAGFDCPDDRELAREVFRRINLDIAEIDPFDPLPDRARNWRSVARSYQVPSWKSGSELDLLAAGEDTERVWWEDLNQIRRGSDGYARTLRRWSEISRGAFQPTNMAESWGEDGESVLVTFQLDGDEHVFIHLTSYDDQIDTAGLRNCINPLIAQSGIQFEIVELNDTPNIVLALRPEERRVLSDERGWKFAEIPTVTV